MAEYVQRHWRPWAAWFVGYLLAVYLEVAMLYIMASTLYGLWRNTSTTSAPVTDASAGAGFASASHGAAGQRPLSAYSVFNPGLKKLDGTLDAERIDRELRGWRQ